VAGAQAGLIPLPSRVQLPHLQPLTITMPINTTTPFHRVTRMLREGVRLMAVQRGQTSIDVTPDIVALLDGVQTGSNPPDESRNLLKANALRRDVPTRVHFP